MQYAYKNGKILNGTKEMHVHLAGNGKPQKKQRDNAKLVKTLMSNGISRAIAYRMVAGFAKDELLSGVTTIRTVGGLGTFDTRLRDEIKAGKKTGPRILAANEGIIDCAKKAIANDIPVVLGNDVGCPWITQYDFWRELFYFHKYVGVSNHIRALHRNRPRRRDGRNRSRNRNDRAGKMCRLHRHRKESARRPPCSAPDRNGCREGKKNRPSAGKT